MKTRILQPITSEKKLGDALQWIDELMEKDENGRGLSKKELALLDALATLVEAYEDKVRPLDRSVDPIAVLQSVMHERGLLNIDLVRMGIFSSRGRATDALTYQRKLSIGNIRDLHRHLSIPLEILFNDYNLEKKSA